MTQQSDEELERAIKGTDVLRRELLDERARRAAKRGIYYCTACRVNTVAAEDGQDKCDDCMRRV